MTLSSEPLYPEVDAPQVSTETKFCLVCKVPLLLINFQKLKRSKDGLRPECKVCRRGREQRLHVKRKTQLEERYKLSILRHETENTVKICPKPNCPHFGVAQHWTHFYRNYVAPDGLQMYCVDCVNERALRKKFGVGYEWYNQTLAEQEGKCAICRSLVVEGKKFAIDHDHQCCPVNHACDNCRRGLLCFACNSRLGHIENDGWKRQAIAYLNRFKRLKTTGHQDSLFD